MLTGSSARKLRRRGVNLLAGRALTRHLRWLEPLHQYLGNLVEVPVESYDREAVLGRRGGDPQVVRGYWRAPAPEVVVDHRVPVRGVLVHHDHRATWRCHRFVERLTYGLLRPLVDLALGRSERLAEIPMRDVRFLLLFVAGLACVALAAASLARGTRREPWSGRETALLAWWITAYVAWALLFYTYRYAALLEFTAPLVLFLLLRRLAPARHALTTVVAAALLILATTRSGSWGRRPWQTPWLRLTVPALGQQPDSLVLMVGQPSASVIPSFRPDARFVNVTGVARFGAPAKWNALVEQVVRDHRGPLLLLSNFEFSRADCEARAAALGLRTTPRCEPIRDGSLRFRLCELQRE